MDEQLARFTCSGEAERNDTGNRGAANRSCAGAYRLCVIVLLLWDKRNQGDGNIATLYAHGDFGHGYGIFKTGRWRDRDLKTQYGLQSRMVVKESIRERTLIQ